MESREKTRTPWTELPDRLRGTVEGVLGGAVVEAISQANGFSPGSADRVRTADGRRAFVKSAVRTVDEGSYGLHERELAVMRRMPEGVRAPRLLGAHVEDDHIALIMEDIDGRHPGAALDGSDVTAVLDALASFPRVVDDGSGVFLRAEEEFAEDAAGWRQLEADGAVDDLSPWARAAFPRILEAAGRAASAVAGEHLQHLDCRADNVLVDGRGEAWVIDWPWAGIGAKWTDGVGYLFDVRMRGERFDVENALRTHPLFEGVAAADIDAFLAAVTGGFLFRSRLPSPPGMPTLREFQRQEALVGLDWLRERWD